MDPVLFLRPSAATSGHSNGTADTGVSPNTGLPGTPAGFLSVLRNNLQPPGPKFHVSGSDAAKDPDGKNQEMCESCCHEYGHAFGAAKTPEPDIDPDTGLQRAASEGDDAVPGADDCLVLVTAPELPSKTGMAECRMTAEETQEASLQNMPAKDTEWFPAEATPVVLSATAMTETEMRRQTPPARQEALNVVNLREDRQVQEPAAIRPSDAQSSAADTTGQGFSLITMAAPRIIVPGEEQAADRSAVAVPSTERIPTQYPVLIREALQTPSKTVPEPPSSGTDPETTADHAPVVSNEKQRGLSMNRSEMQVGIWRSEAEPETTGRPLREGWTAAGVTDSGLAGKQVAEHRTATPERQTTHNSHIAVLSLEQVLNKRTLEIPAEEKPSSPDQNPTNGTTRTRPDVNGGLVSAILESGSTVAEGRTRLLAAEDVEAEPPAGAGHLTSLCTTSDPKVAAPGGERSSGIPNNLPAGLGHRLAETAAQFLDRPLELTLSPEELGRVRMSFATQDGALTMLLQADRQETLELLRRNIDQLAQDFRDLGFQDLTFHFGQGQDQHSSPSVVNDEDRTDTRSEDTEFIATAVTNDPTSRLAGNGGLDLRI